jgi:FtsP/CotA-like multicopper oxidase with cupredoxin domain
LFILENENEHRVKIFDVLVRVVFMVSMKLPKNNTITVAVLSLILTLASTAISTPQILYATNATLPASTLTKVFNIHAMHTRVFNIYNTNVLGFNETKGIHQAGLESDQFSLQTIIVNQGDRVVIHFYNMEAPTGDRHSFTINAPYNGRLIPYNVDIDVAPGQNGTATFVANQPGIYLYACKYHYPSMVGQLIILPHEG